VSDQPRVAVVGAGPAGSFAAAQLLSGSGGPDVDLFERLPTPWGLLRGGVAPDHHEIKRLDQLFDRQVLRRPRCRYFGNVEVGKDLSHGDLMRHYHAVVYATGAQTDKSLGIPGEDLLGSLPATDFVGWYNGHPDRRALEPELSGRRAVIIGNGNVAADVARMLTLGQAELERTDTADHALDALRDSAVEEVVVLGRRGPAQAAFTSAELRELGNLEGVELVVDPAEIELDPVSEEWLASEGTFTARKNLELLREFAAREPDPGAQRRIVLRFLRSPVEILGTGRVEGVRIQANRIARDDSGALRALPVEGELGDIECSLVLRSVGYQAVPLPDVPFDERRYVLPNEQGRVVDAGSGDRLPGVYAVGWIKRGPTGILGTNKRDAAETVRCLEEDLAAGELSRPVEAIDTLLAERVPDLVTLDGWRAIDELEQQRGRNTRRPRVKLASREELLAAAE
jgi:ferredoxin/flavodoxin---NADP+ reductase